MKKRRPNGYRKFERNLRLFILECVREYTKKITMAEIQVSPDYDNIDYRKGGQRWILVNISINGVKFGNWKFVIQDSEYSWLTKSTFQTKLLKRFITCKLRKK